MVNKPVSKQINFVQLSKSCPMFRFQPIYNFQFKPVVFAHLKHCLMNYIPVHVVKMMEQLNSCSRIQGLKAHRVPRRYIVEAGKTLDDVWNVKKDNQGLYDLWVMGPNGFHRHFKDLTNMGTKDVELVISPVVYRSDAALKITVKAGQTSTRHWELKDTWQWTLSFIDALQDALKQVQILSEHVTPSITTALLASVATTEAAIASITLLNDCRETLTISTILLPSAPTASGLAGSSRLIIQATATSISRFIEPINEPPNFCCKPADKPSRNSAPNVDVQRSLSNTLDLPLLSCKTKGALFKRSGNPTGSTSITRTFELTNGLTVGVKL
ncbi:unnamed protein product [Oppiella nova]|uniref:Bacterial phospholipase C C-terminal domain-containing protein n=1 Tax=Oppiella nova TaxID=334625 RepID=A0A7R9Q9H3_9ACAR|nr:unnamed protein product [Oppiella nova]CAG2157308.1 unnamed protein product [Oppiella nova]